MIEFANCKINIGLDIVRKRPDGYHDISTLFVPVPWCDVVEVLPSQSGQTTLTVLGNKVDCPTEKNLAYKAWQAMHDAYGAEPVDIVLQKIIPDGAGLGGGSSDAAFVIRLVNQVQGLGLSDEQMAEVAATIGADCPFFIYNRPMMASGIGNIFEPVDIDLSAYALLIAKPADSAVSTKDAYTGVTPAEPFQPITDFLSLPIEQWQGRIKNDFEPSVFVKAPRIAQVKQSMLQHGALYCAMSGSGASVFAFFDSDKLAESCRDTLPDCQSWLGHVDF